MAQFTLPKNSKYTEGKTWPKPAGASNLQAFRIYRWNPDDGSNPKPDSATRGPTPLRTPKSQIGA